MQPSCMSAATYELVGDELWMGAAQRAFACQLVCAVADLVHAHLTETNDNITACHDSYNRKSAPIQTWHTLGTDRHLARSSTKLKSLDTLHIVPARDALDK